MVVDGEIEDIVDLEVGLGSGSKDLRVQGRAAAIGVGGQVADGEVAADGLEIYPILAGNVADIDGTGGTDFDVDLVGIDIATAGEPLGIGGAGDDIVGGVEGAGKDDGRVDGVEVEVDVAVGQGGAGQGNGRGGGIDELDIAVERGGRADDQGIVHVDGAGGGLGE